MGKETVDDSQDLLRTVELPATSLKEEVFDTFDPVRQLLVVKEDPFDDYRGKSLTQKALTFLFWVFPICEWVSTYKPKQLVGDVIGGLTITSLAVPQDLAYAGLAGVPPINGLYSSFIPPLVYAILGTSRHIAIGPTAVVSLLLGSLLKDYVNPDDDPTLYLQLAFTATFFSGIIQLGMGLLRLGFIIDFMSHAAIVGFMAGAAVTISLSQLKGLLGYKTFTNNTDIVSVLTYVFQNTGLFNWRAFTIGIVFLVYLLTIKFLAWWFKGKKVVGKVFFFLNALGPLTCVFIATLSVYLTKSNKLVPCVKSMPRGLDQLSSVGSLLLSGPWVGTAAAIGTVVGLISLTEATAIARTFAAMKGYHIDGNKEMIALGAMNLAGSVSSSIATTGSFSRSAVNYNAGGQTQLTGIIMSTVIVITLVALTQVFIYLPNAVLSAIIISAVLGLIDLEGMWKIWKADKIDFLVVVGTFFGVIFASVEIGLLIGVALSMFKILVLVTRPHLAILGEIPGAAVYRNIRQYKYAKTQEGILALRIDAPIFFTNANFIRERVLTMAEKYESQHGIELTHVVLDCTPVPDVDTTGIHSLEELYRMLKAMDIVLGISNPSRIVLRKLAVSGFVELIGRDNLFLSVNEAAKTFSMTRATSERLPSQRVVVELTENGHTNGVESDGNSGQVHSVNMA